jgi:hypothetical protein
MSQPDIKELNLGFKILKMEVEKNEKLKYCIFGACRLWKVNFNRAFDVL